MFSKWKSVAFVTAVSVILVLSSCTKKSATTKKYVLPENLETVQSKIIDENENLQLFWDNELNCIALKNKKTGYVWSNMPKEYYEKRENEYNTSAQIEIEYYTPKNGSIQIEKSTDLFDSGMVNSKVSGKKLIQTYYFDICGISISVSYSITNKGMRVEIDSSSFTESKESKLISISVLPYLCSATNVDDKSNYLLVPTGCGAIMYTDNEPGDYGRMYSGNVYGTDKSIKQLDNVSDETAIRLPVFGVKSGNNSLFSIIRSDETSSRIYATSGDPLYNCSNIYAKFYVRGYNNIEWDTGRMASGKKLIEDTVLLTDDFAQKNYVIDYYPLEDADYSKMAKFYADDLKKNGLIKKSELSQKNLSLSIVGGTLKKGFFCGIPYEKFSKITTFSETQSIINEISGATSATLQLQMLGYGKSGLYPQRIAGGFDYSHSLGNKKEFNSLIEFCKKSSVDLFFDFNITQFSKSGSGYSTIFNVAKSADMQRVSTDYLKQSTRDIDSSFKTYYVSKNKINGIFDKVIKASNNMNISGISISDYADATYSDFSDERYYLRGRLRSQFEYIRKNLETEEKSLLTSSANAYAAGNSDSIVNVPITSGNYVAFDEDIPFYQMIFGGNIPLYSTPLNLADNTDYAKLKAVEYGVSPSFVLGKDPSVTLKYTSFYDQYGILYSGNKLDIINTVNETKPYYDLIKGSEIIFHDRISENLTKTVFDNGIEVYVNYSNEKCSVDQIEIEANSFVYK